MSTPLLDDVSPNGAVPDGVLFEAAVPVSESTDGQLWCEEGQHPFTHTGRGRKPKSCIEHRKTSRASTAGRTPRVANLEKALTDVGLGIGKAVSMFEAFDGQVICQGTPQLAHAMTNYAERDPKFRRSIEKALSNMGMGEMIVAAAMIAIPIMMHHGMIPQSVVNRAQQAMYSNMGGNVPTG